MTIPNVTYPLDLTGTNPINLIRGEVHPIAQQKVRAIATTHGPFYVESLEVVESSTGRLLEKGRDYFATELCVIPTNLSGKDACSIVILTDPMVAGFVSLNYQVVGGKYSDSDASLADLLNSIDFDNRNPNWPSPIVKSEDYPLSERLFGQGVRFGFEYAVQTLNRIQLALSQGNQLARQAIYDYLEASIGKVTPDLVLRTQLAMRSAIAKHKKQPDPHVQYFRRDEKIDFDPVRTPINKTPVLNATGVSNHTSIIGNTYGSLYRAAHKTSHFQVSAFPDMSALLVDVIPSVSGASFSLKDLLTPGTRYYWRVRYCSEENYWSGWSNVTSFTTVAGAIKQPSIDSPVNNSIGVALRPTITASAFATVSGADTHDSTDWEIWTGSNGTGTKVFSSYDDKVNKVSITVPDGVLTAGLQYYPRVRQRGVVLGVSGWSNAVGFQTANSGVSTPAITEPANGAVEVSTVTTLRSTAFGTTNATDTHASSDWELWSGVNGTGELLFSSYNNALAKTAFTLPEGSLLYSKTYHARVRHKGTSIGLSGWSNSVAFTTTSSPPAAGTILDTRCQGYDRYNLVADGQYGSEWVLAETNSASCGYNPARIAAPEWTSTNNRQFTERLGTFAAFVGPFRVEYGTDTFTRLEWQLYIGDAIHRDGFTTAPSTPVEIAAANLYNHSSYRVRSRFIGQNLPASDWSAWHNFTTEWEDPLPAGTVIRTYCDGYDKYEQRADGDYGSYNVLVEAYSSFCGYTAPLPAGTVIRTFCVGYDKYEERADGNYGSTNVLVESNSAYCDYVAPTNPPAGTVLNTYCDGTTKMATKADGNGGSYNEVVAYNSTDCGYVAPTNPPAGTELSTYCSGTTLMAVIADGNGGSTNQVKQSNSPTCGYVEPPPSTAPAPTMTMSSTSFDGKSAGESAYANISVESDGIIQGNSGPSGISDWGRWIPVGANAADYELFWTTTSNEVTFSSSSADTWHNLAGGWLATVEDNSGSGQNVQVFASLDITIRVAADHSKSVSFTIVISCENYTFQG